MNTRLALTTGFLLFASVACFEEDSCDRYVEYMCDCHSGEEGYDCGELQALYSDADEALQNQCAIDLSAQQDADDDNGVVCDAGGDSGI